MIETFRKPEISGRWAGATQAEQRQLVEQAHAEALVMDRVGDQVKIKGAEHVMHYGVQRPAVAELTAIATGPVRGRGNGGKTDRKGLSEHQLRVLWAADNPSGGVGQNGSTGVTRPAIRALAEEGYGRAVMHMTRKHLIIGFEINDRGRAAARARFGFPAWTHTYVAGVTGCVAAGLAFTGFVGTPVESCGQSVEHFVHNPIS